MAREHSYLEWTLDQLRQSIAKEIGVLKAGAFLPLSQSEDHHRPTASFLTGAMSRLETRKPLKCAFCKSSFPNVMPFQTDLNAWTLPDERSCASIVSAIIESVNVSQKATVNTARSDTIPV